MAKSFYITTPIYYVNDKPHIGHAYTTVACDVLARFRRLQGKEVFFLTGTDEHGKKIQKAAEKNASDSKSYVDFYAGIFQDAWSALDISNDDFIRTTQERHYKSVAKFWQIVNNNGDIYKGKYSGWYCVPCETFFSDDQLVDGKCPDCGREVEWMEEESYFFKLSKYTQPLLDLYNDKKNFVMPDFRRNEVIQFVSQGLKDLSISRSKFSWGIKVPDDPGHVIYVWFDALLNYLTAAGFAENEERFRSIWPADVHVVGKEIVRFHAIIWPAMLMSAKLPLPKMVFGHGWWTMEGEKMSKSKGNVVDIWALSKEVGVDPMRYFLMKAVPFGQDGDFSHKGLRDILNADLANDFGNLLNRTASMLEKYNDSSLSDADKYFDKESYIKLRNIFDGMKERIEKHYDNLSFSFVLEEIMILVKGANKFLDETSPWRSFKEKGFDLEVASTFYHVFEVIRLAAIALYPFMPTISGDVLKRLSVNKEADWSDFNWGLLPIPCKIEKGEPIFKRLDT